jgi:tetratricopeptide (TPR) repeat protein
MIDRPSPSEPRETPYQRYGQLIEQTIANTLKGQIRSKEQVYRLLMDQLEPGMDEIFECALAERTETIAQQLNAATDELAQAKLQRQQRALKTIQDTWEQWRQTHQVQSTCSTTVQAILNGEAAERLAQLIDCLDPNQTDVFDHQTIQQLAQTLQITAETLPVPEDAFQLRQFGVGLQRGLVAFSHLEDSLVSWLYEPTSQPGFAATPMGYSPWELWAKKSNSPLARELFLGQAQNHSAAVIALAQQTADVATWIELFVLLRGVQHGVIKWFDQQPYSLQAGRHMSGVTFLVFAMIWCELSTGFLQSTHLVSHERDPLAQLCFQAALQGLRSFARRKNFPLYGGAFASFSGQGFRDTITYLDRPLKVVENTQEKARILTVLGYSQRRLGNIREAIALHQEALDLARQMGDQPCEIANLTHLSRLSLEQKEFNQALDSAQRALILARQIAERQGEANALASLGYSEVMIAQQQERVSLEELEPAIRYLEQGRELAEKLQDVQNLALCQVGVGIAYVALQQPDRAQQALEQGIGISQQIGDRDLQASGHTSLGEAYYQLNRMDLAIYHSCLGMYLFEQRQNAAWKQAAALIMILEGQLGQETFAQRLQQQRSQLISQIGVDGFDYLPELIQRYRQGE